MNRRNKRILTDQHIETALLELGRGRSAAIVICTNTKPFGDEYRAAHNVLMAIDKLAVALGKEHNHFHV